MPVRLCLNLYGMSWLLITKNSGWPVACESLRQAAHLSASQFYHLSCAQLPPLPSGVNMVCFLCHVVVLAPYLYLSCHRSEMVDMCHCPLLHSTVLYNKGYDCYNCSGVLQLSRWNLQYIGPFSSHFVACRRFYVRFKVPRVRACTSPFSSCPLS